MILEIDGQAPAGAVGWPLLLSLALVPFRLVDWIDNEVAVGVGIAIAIVANAVTIFVTAFIGHRVSGSRRIGIAAAALFTALAVSDLAAARRANVGEQRLGRSRPGSSSTPSRCRPHVSQPESP